MEPEKGKTARYLREKQGGAPKQALDNLKEFNRIRKSILEALSDEELTIQQVAGKTGMSLADTTYHLLSMLKYGQLKVGAIDDMDEYFTYKINK